MNIRTVLQIINRIAKILPFLAPFIERVTAALLARMESSDELIRRRLRTDSLVQPQKPEKQDAVEEQTEVAPSTKKDEPASVPPTINQNAPEQINASTLVPAQEITLKQIEQDFQDSRERKARMLRNINAQESTVFRLMVVFSLVSLLFIIWGGYIMFQGGLNVL